MGNNLIGKIGQSLKGVLTYWPFSYVIDWKQKNRINQWLKLLNIEPRAILFQDLYQDQDGFLLSRQARNKQDALDYIYGEIDFVPFIALLSLVQPNEKTVFYDLGSGIGKAVIACALVYPVQQSVGIELLPELHTAAEQIAKKLSDMQPLAPQANTIKFIEGDFLEVDFNAANLLFINATTLFNPTWEKLCARLDNLQSDSIVISTSKPILSTNFTLLKTTKLQMSWGPVRAFIQQRKTNCH